MSHVRGEDHPSSRISQATVVAILRSPYKHDALAMEFGISRRHVRDIKSGRRWRHVYRAVFGREP
jgi:hypothetical protein